MLNINNQRNINQNCNETLLHTSITMITVGERQTVEKGREGGRKKGKKTSINEDMENQKCLHCWESYKLVRRLRVLYGAS